MTATGPSRTVVYDFDALGNRTSVVDNGTNTIYAINNLNQYTAIGSKHPVYDSKGNLANDGIWTFSYDHDNNLIGATKSGVTVSYQHDAIGRRYSKTVNGVKTMYVYAGSNLIEERNGNGAIKAQYLYEPGVDRPVKAIVGGYEYYFILNDFGDVIALTGADGQIIEQCDYDIYGKSTIKDGVGKVKATSLTPFLFAGREYDGETGLYHYRARAYSPELGRFLQPDPIDFSGGDSNLYRYCRNNPLYWKDSSGLKPEKCVVVLFSGEDTEVLNAAEKLADGSPECTAAGIFSCHIDGVMKTSDKGRAASGKNPVNWVNSGQTVQKGFASELAGFKDRMNGDTDVPTRGEFDELLLQQARDKALEICKNSKCKCKEVKIIKRPTNRNVFTGGSEVDVETVPCN